MSILFSYEYQEYFFYFFKKNLKLKGYYFVDHRGKWMRCHREFDLHKKNADFICVFN
jgi:hypothetical protein